MLPHHGRPPESAPVELSPWRDAGRRVTIRPAMPSSHRGRTPTRPAFTKNPLEVSIPSADPAGATPTGQVFNGSSDFKVPSGPTTTAAARFIFASQTGEIAGWNGGTQAKVAVTVPGASFTGLAIGSV